MVGTAQLRLLPTLQNESRAASRALDLLAQHFELEPAVFGGVTTLHSGGKYANYVMLPIIPAKAEAKKLAVKKGRRVGKAKRAHR